MRHIMTLAATLVAILALPGITFAGNASTVKINEISYDDSSTDDREFVELYNSGGSAVDISGWLLRASDTVAPPGDNNADYTIPAATTIPAGGYYVLGSALVPNVDLIVGATNLWENSNEALELFDAAGAIHDTVIYELNKGLVTVSPAEGGIWGNFTSINGQEMSWSRFRDGVDTNVNGRDFGLHPSTPGTSNNLPANANYQVPDVDALALTVGADVTGTLGSFVTPRVIDPTVADGNNPNAIPPSPHGGNVIVAWDPSGGGNGSVGLELADEFLIDAYLDSTPFGVGGGEQTAYGIGTVDTFFNFGDPTDQFFPGAGVTANGSTGIGWFFQKEDSASNVKLLLIDFGPGGNGDLGGGVMDWTVIATIDLFGQPAAWHRLGIDYDPATGNVVASYDGSTYMFTTDSGILGTFYAGYRESLAGAPTNLRPPTFDVIPEPASFVLLGLAVIGLAITRRR